MNRQEFEKLFKIEESYWWFVGQRFLLYQFLKRKYLGKQNLKLLDVGCGTGLTLRLLNRFGKAYGIDIADEAVKFCSKRGYEIKKSDVMNLCYPSNTFDVVTSLGVFYHKDVTDDVKGMKEICRVLKPGGRFFILDSAMKCLYSKHDLVFQGIRRYSRKELAGKLCQAGFKIEKITYYNTLFFPLIYLKRKIDAFSQSRPQSDLELKISPFLNNLMKRVYFLELRQLKYFNYPFGVNILAVATKSSTK